MTGAERAALAEAHAHGPGRVVEPGPSPATAPPPGPRAPLRALAAHGRFGAALAHLLTAVATPLRWEPWNQYNDHRLHPSARAAHTVDLVLVAGGRWVLDAVRRELVGTGAPALGDAVEVDLVRRRDRLSAGYREFGDVLTELEVGHVAAALVEHAGRLGLRAHADGAVVRVSSHRETGEPAAPPPARSSGVGPRGIAADPRPLPAAVLDAVARAVARSPGQLRHRLAVRDAEGRADGWYAVDDGLRLISPGAAVPSLAPVFGHPPAVIDVASANLALVTTGDPSAAVAARGPDGYRALLRAAGATAQHVCEAAAGTGAFCRPARSADDGALEALVGAPAAHCLLYLLVVGRPRGSGFTYDLSPLEAR
ncbi:MULTISPECIES: hypothetical protein [Actinosynnema]|uniref:hypothetical protein n=1 Tax=Actinosynnema TaxID=40566 RepID=UPI0020A2E897|nr:hypothetical protein [Actinosynnema pretiosum]MCP2098128.1 hypothetical protein [Actinosynnema pretiosum]